MTEIALRQWRENFNSGAYDAKDNDTQCTAGWYDWFCHDGELANRLIPFGRLAEHIRSDRILDGYRVWFVNVSPCDADTYDQVRFEPLDRSRRNELYFVVSVDECRDLDGMEDKYKVYTARTRYEREFSTDDPGTMAEWIDANF